MPNKKNIEICCEANVRTPKKQYFASEKSKI